MKRLPSTAEYRGMYLPRTPNPERGEDG
jgi:hypothetical protein